MTLKAKLVPVTTTLPNHVITVQNLATQNIICSVPFPTTPFGVGIIGSPGYKLQISHGSSSVTIDLSPSFILLDDIIAAVNMAAPDAYWGPIKASKLVNPTSNGITGNLANGSGNQTFLVLSGATNISTQVSYTPTQNYSPFPQFPFNTENFTQVQAMNYANFTVDGVAYETTTNVVSGIIPGYNIDLTAPSYLVPQYKESVPYFDIEVQKLAVPYVAAFNASGVNPVIVQPGNVEIAQPAIFSTGFETMLAMTMTEVVDSINTLMPDYVTASAIINQANSTSSLILQMNSNLSAPTVSNITVPSGSQVSQFETSNLTMLQQGQPAQFTINGTAYSFQSNVISGLIYGYDIVLSDE